MRLAPVLVMFAAVMAVLGGCAAPEERGGVSEMRHGRAMLAAAGGPGRLGADSAGIFLASLMGPGKATLARADLVLAEGAMWRAADSDHDGVLRAGELNAWRTIWFGTEDGWPGLFFFDHDGDGAVAQGEFNAGLERVFDGFDKDKKGVLDRAALLTQQTDPGTRRSRPDSADSAGEDKQVPAPPSRDQGQNRRPRNGRPGGN